MNINFLLFKMNLRDLKVQKIEFLGEIRCNFFSFLKSECPSFIHIKFINIYLKMKFTRN
jgi:hypothetical protein